MCIIVVLFLAFACDEDSADYAGQQQDADDLERQHVAVFSAAHQRVADGPHVQFAVLEMRGQEVVAERYPEADAQAGQRGAQPHEELVALQVLGLVALARRQEDREDVEHRDAARVDEQLHGSEERVVELEIDARRAEEHEQQVGRRTQDTPRRDGQHGAHRRKERQRGEDDRFECYLHDLLFIELFDELFARVDGVLEIGREADRAGRAGVDAQVAEHARPQVVLVTHQPPLRTPRLGIYDVFSRQADRAVGACRLAEPAGDAAVLPLGVVRHREFAAEAVVHLQRRPVLGVLFRHLGREELPPGHLHAREQRPQPVKKSFDIIRHS